MTEGTFSYQWDCSGTGGASGVSCSATRNYVVSTTGANGSFSPTSQQVVYNAATSFTVSANSGYSIVSVTASGCSGSLSGNTFSISQITANCTVTGNFANLAPTATGLGVSGTVQVGVGLTGSYTYQDAESDSESGTTVQWYADSQSSGATKAFLSGANTANYTPAAGDVGKYLFFCVTPRAASGTSPGVETCSAAAGPVAAAAVSGACGTDNGQTLTSTPANLCTTGSASSVTPGTTSYTWTCGGSGGGSSASCSATRNYAVTLAAGANGHFGQSSPQTLAYGATPTLTLVPDSGYSIQSVSGCGGSLNGSTYTLGPVTAACTVTASFGQNSACGPAAGTATAFAPSGASNLCAAGTPSGVTAAAPWSWTCTGAGTPVTCTAPNQSTSTASGTGRALVSGGTWTVNTAQSSGFVPVPASPPAGYTFPHGLMSFTLQGGATGSSATVNITYPSPIPAGSVYWKYGRTAANPTAHWYEFPNAVISGNTVTLTLTDNALGDDAYTTDGVISDPGGIALAGSGGAAEIPTLGEWSLLGFSGLLGLFGLAGLGRFARRTGGGGRRV